MRDRWVALFAVFCLAQLPLYLMLGREPIAFDAAIKSAEARLLRVSSDPEDQRKTQEALDQARTSLDALGGNDSRTARLEASLALLAWTRGKIGDADGHFRSALTQLEATHGPDAFYTAVISCRYGEFLMLNQRRDEALARFDVGLKPVEDTMGPKTAFAVRMVFRRVALLTELGRNQEAMAQATEYLPALLEHAGRYDEVFLFQTASTLEILARGKPGLPAPPGGRGWRAALRQSFEDGKARMAEGSEEG